MAMLDFRELFTESKELKDFVIKKARIGMNDGAQFGKEGEGFQRMNFACSRVLVKEACERIKKAINLE